MQQSDELEYLSEDDDGSTKPMDISLNRSLDGYNPLFWTTQSIAHQFEQSCIPLDDSTTQSKSEITSEEESDQPVTAAIEKQDKTRSRSSSTEKVDIESEGSPSTNRKKMRAALSDSMGLNIHAMAKK